MQIYVSSLTQASTAINKACPKIIKAACIPPTIFDPAFLFADDSKMLVGSPFPVAVALAVTDVNDGLGSVKVVSALLQIEDPTSSFVG
jgi:hypothetical protein